MDQNIQKLTKSNDQYEEYERLPILLKRFSFKEKMHIAHVYSSQGIMFNRNIKKNKSMVLPWCVETFVMLSMEATEYGSGDFKGKNVNKAIKMLNAIWSATSEALKRSCGRFEFMDVFLPVTLLTQFKCQEIDEVLKYRYWYILDHNFKQISLKDIFESKMGASYEEYLMFGEILEVIFLARADNRNVTIPREVLEYIFVQRFPLIANKMTISRENYVKLQHDYIKKRIDPYSYVYSLCPSVRYPLIEVGDSIYFPLPHLLMRTVTDSMMYRITENDDSIRRKIGKHVLEQYLYDIVRDSNVYDEVSPEVKYKKSREDALSPDVIARQGKDVLFLDSKSTVPSVGIRVMEAADFEKNIDIIGKNIEKLVRRIREFDLYNPFKENVSKNQKDYWGIVVVQEDSFIRRQFYYEKARIYLGVEEDSEDWRWIIEHIKVASLYEVEKIALSCRSLIDACKQCFQEDPYAYPFFGFTEDEFILRNKRAVEFTNEHNKKVDKVINEIKQLLDV